ncbi:hypothetical protein OG21DRAFT_1023647 [Imleria badia]|nr:hypothetical protein OG21DRAFT_1023647 [Imleria badia]
MIQQFSSRGSRTHCMQVMFISGCIKWHRLSVYAKVWKKTILSFFEKRRPSTTKAGA